jgi:hypothetical protein
MELMERTKLRRMMSNIATNKRNVGLLHFPKTIVLNQCFHNYVRRLPRQLGFYMHLMIGSISQKRCMDSFNSHGGKDMKYKSNTWAIEHLLSHRTLFLFPSSRIIDPLMFFVSILYHYILYSSINIHIA